MRTNGLGYKDAEFVAEIDKKETRCTFDEVVTQLKQQMNGSEKVNFIMVCEPDASAVVDGRCDPEKSEVRKFCVGIVFAETFSAMDEGRSVKATDLGDRFSVSFENVAAIDCRPPGSLKETMRRLFSNENA
jgi:hypothetical protein